MFINDPPATYECDNFITIQPLVDVSFIRNQNSVGLWNAITKDSISA